MARAETKGAMKVGTVLVGMARWSYGPAMRAERSLGMRTLPKPWHVKTGPKFGSIPSSPRDFQTVSCEMHSKREGGSSLSDLKRSWQPEFLTPELNGTTSH